MVKQTNLSCNLWSTGKEAKKYRSWLAYFFFIGVVCNALDLSDMNRSGLVKCLVKLRNLLATFSWGFSLKIKAITCCYDLSYV